MNHLLRLLAVFLLLGCALPARAEKPKLFLFKPSTGAGPFPVALWLHGYRGYSPTGYFPRESEAAMQKHADALGAVIIGFPATTDLGDKTQQWSEEPVADHAYIQDRLRQLEKANNLNLKRVGLFGFSEGGMVAAELASLYPDFYLGAIVMSPGGITAPKAATLKGPSHARQVYYCFCGAGEAERTVQLTKIFAKHLEEVLGAKVTTKIYPDVSEHTRPPDFMENFPTWMGAILKAGEPAK